MLCTAVVFWLAGRHSRTPFATVLIGQPTLRRMIKLTTTATLILSDALIEAIGHLARRQGCTRLWVITTNDNVDALRFYQRRGFCLVRVHRGAVDRSRASLKPEIPRWAPTGSRCATRSNSKDNPEH